MKWIKILIVAVICAVITGICSLNANNIVIRIVDTVVSALLGVIISSFYEFVDTHDQGLKMWFNLKFRKGETDFFVSFSYLYRIQVDGKYLMVAGHRIPGQFQPVGGVYKYYKEAKPQLEKIEYRPNVDSGNSDETDDLRLNIKGKYLLEFYDWFMTMKNREYDPRREFYEELIKPGILPDELFRNCQYRKVSIHNIGLTYSESYQKDEWIYADIFEIELNEDQKKVIREAVNKHSNTICLVTDDEIKRRTRSGSPKQNLGTNAPWIL